MHKITTIFIFTLFVTLMGCASLGSSIRDDYDEFSGSNLREVRLYIQESEWDPFPQKLFLRQAISGNNTAYMVCVSLSLHEWIFADTIYFLIDGERTIMESIDYDHNVSGGLVDEWVVFDSSLDFFYKLANAENKVKIKLSGSKGTKEYQFDRRNQKWIVEFLAYLEKHK